MTYHGYRCVPVPCLACEDDQAVPVNMQRGEIAMMEKESCRAVDVQIIATGHCPYISAPDKIVKWVLSLVGKC